MASKILVKLPVNFGSQVGKCTTADIISASVNGANSPSPAPDSSTTSSSDNSPSESRSISQDTSLQVIQLEQNIKFLKEQHHLMLTSLHHEVEILRQRNRDLQFQLVFSKGSLALMKSTPSSPEDDSKSQLLLSPKQVNVTPLQVEILERDVTELKSSLSEARARNSCLENIIDEQKKQLENSTKNTPPSEDSLQAAGNTDPDLAFKLEEAEKVIRRLRRENDEQRRELALIKANNSREQASGNNTAQRLASQWALHQNHDQQREFYNDQHRDPQREPREQRDHRREHPRETPQDPKNDKPDSDQAREGSRFPPLNNQKFWHNNGGTQRGRWNHSWDSSRGAVGTRMLNQSLPSIPGLPMTSNSLNTSTNGNPNSAPFSLLSHGGGRRHHRGNFRGDRSGGGRGGNGSGQSGNRGQWDHNRDQRGRDRDRNRDHQTFPE